MRKISKGTATILENDPRMKVCALKGIIPHVCSMKLDWHHNLIFGGRQSDIPETILAICDFIHDMARKTEVKERLDWIMLNLMSDEQIRSISKATDYFFVRNRLNAKYGHY